MISSILGLLIDGADAGSFGLAVRPEQDSEFPRAALEFALVNIGTRRSDSLERHRLQSTALFESRLEKGQLLAHCSGQAGRHQIVVRLAKPELLDDSTRRSLAPGIRRLILHPLRDLFGSGAGSFCLGV